MRLSPSPFFGFSPSSCCGVLFTLTAGAVVVLGVFRSSHAGRFETEEFRAVSASPRAQTVPRAQAWEETIGQAKEAMDRGALAEAERRCDEALELIKAVDRTDLRIAKTLLLSAQIYRAQQNAPLAEKRFKDAIASAEAAVGPLSPQLLPPLENLASFYFLVRQRYDLALPIYERMLKLLRSEASPDLKEVARQTSNLAGIYEKLERYEEAEALYHQSLNLLEKAGDDVSGILLTIADFYRTWEKLDCAEAMASRAVEIRERSLGTAGQRSVELVVALYKLAEVYRVWEKPDRAKSVYDRCLAVIEKTDDFASSAIVQPLAGRAAVLRDQGKLVEAEADYRRALAIANQTMDPALPEVTTLVDIYAGLLVQLHRNNDADTIHALHQWRTFIHGASRELKANHLSDAERLCDAALELAAGFKVSPINPCDGYLLKGEIRRLQGKRDLAEQSYNQAVKACEETAGRDAPELIAPLEALANFYHYNRGHQRQVVRLNQRILSIVEKRGDSSEVARRSRNVADAFRQMHCSRKAATYYQKAVAEIEKTPGDPGERVQYLQALGDFYRSCGRYSEAEEAHARALRLRERAVEVNPSPEAQLDIAVCLDALAEDFLADKQPEKAESFCRQSVSVVMNLNGMDHADLVPRLTRLSVALKALGRQGEAEASVRHALRILEKNPGLPEQLASDESYATLLQELKRPDEAKALLARVGKARDSSAAR